MPKSRIFNVASMHFNAIRENFRINSTRHTSVTFNFTVQMKTSCLINTVMQKTINIYGIKIHSLILAVSQFNNSLSYYGPTLKGWTLLDLGCQPLCLSVHHNFISTQYLQIKLIDVHQFCICIDIDKS